VNRKKSTELTMLQTILWIYIIFCIVIAGLNYGYASKASAPTREFISWLWHFYENWIKTAFIILASILTLRIVKTSNRTHLRKRNLMGFTIAALIVHIILPLLLHNPELYLFAMPLPWTTAPLQLLSPSSTFYLSRFPLWGVTGVTFAIIFYLGISATVLIGTFLVGRRWQCSTLCLFNGFAAEVFAPAIPLLGKSKQIKPRIRKIFVWLRWVFFVLALLFTTYWISFLLGIALPGDFKIISKVENYKYLITELSVTLFFWVAFIGRGYCNYCPLGTLLGLCSKLAGQRITTNHSKCTQCNQCNMACSMSIDIKYYAQDGAPVSSLSCVGCGHCIDVCPTNNLAYATKFLDKLPNKPSHSKINVREL
jgi:ferredoxin-type protein NapH